MSWYDEDHATAADARAGVKAIVEELNTEMRQVGIRISIQINIVDKFGWDEDFCVWARWPHSE